MSLPRFITDIEGPCFEGRLILLKPEQARHLHALRIKPGSALELLFDGGPWRADLAGITKGEASARLVRPLHESREAAIPLHACLPITSHLATWEDWLPPLVELGVTHFHPIIYSRSEFDLRRTQAKAERWVRLIAAAVEQSHRNLIPALLPPQPFESLLAWELPQRWVAYEAAVGTVNPQLAAAPLAFTCGPEGGITDDEFRALRSSGWQTVCLGSSILRAVTTPIALMGAIQYQLNR